MLPVLLVGFSPIAVTILEAQDSVLLLLVVVLAYRRLGSSELKAGMLLGLGMFRFQVLLPIVALFLLWRSLKFVVGWAIGSAAVVSVSAAITGVRAQIEYISLLRQMSSVSFWPMLGRMPNLRGLFAAFDFGMVPLVLASLSVFLVATVIGARQNAQQKLLLAISASALVTWFLFLHDLSVLALPVLLAIDEAIGRRDWLRAALASAVLSGFALYWFARDKLYLGALLTLFFLSTQVAGLWEQRKDAKILRGPDPLC